MLTPSSVLAIPNVPAARRHADAALGGVRTLAASVSHQYNNLLMVMRTCGEMLRVEIPTDDRRQKYVNSLLTAVDRAAQLTAQFQAFAPRTMRQPEIVQPSRLLHAAVDVLCLLVPEDVTFRLAARDHTSVECDPVQLRSMVIMLLTRLTESVATRGRITLSVAAVTRPRRGGGNADVRRCVITVSGSGGARARRRRRTLVTARSQPSPHEEPLLYEAWTLARDNGGALSGRVEADGRILLELHFPVVSVRPGRAARQDAPPAPLDGTEIVLLVEDDAAVRWSVREALERYGYTVLEATDGADALRIVGMLNGSPDLILTDLVMPEVGGGELVQTLRREGVGGRVLLMSGYALDSILSNDGSQSRLPLIRKPFTPEALAARVRHVLDA